MPKRNRVTPKKRTKLDAAIFVNLTEDGVVEFIDNGGNESEDGGQEKFDTLVSDCGNSQMFWFAGARVDKIKIVIDEDPHKLVQRLRSKNNGQYWKCNVRSCDPGEYFKYSVIVWPLDGGDSITVDPKAKTGDWPE